MKRSFTLITIFFIFIASSVPCCYDDCNNDTKTENIGNNKHDPKEDACDSCSQFFNCGSCNGFVSILNGSFKVYLSLYYANNLYPFPNSSDFIAKIWQPPMLS